MSVVPPPADAPEAGDEVDARLNLSELLLPVSERRLTRMPRLLKGAIKLVWQAAPREFSLSGALQVLAAVGIAAQVLVGQQLLQRVLDVGDGTDFGDTVPWLVLFAGLGVLLAFANIARVEQQRVLTELVARHALSQVLDVSTSVDLLAYDDPSFHNRLERATTNAVVRPSQMATGVLGVLSAVATIIEAAVLLPTSCVCSR